jgi:hypothetical protein
MVLVTEPASSLVSFFLARNWCGYALDMASGADCNLDDAWQPKASHGLLEQAYEYVLFC